MKRSLILGSAIALALAGCGGGRSDGGDTADTDNSLPEVSGVLPVAGSIDVSRSVAVTADFSEDLFATTVSESSFRLERSSPLAGNVTFNALTNQATFTPDEALAMLTTYTATLGTDITDLSGNALSSDYSWSFTTADGSLSASSEQVVSGDVRNYAHHQIAYHNDGSAIAIWSELTLDGMMSTSQVWANHYTVENDWGTPVPVQIEISSNWMPPELATDKDGNAIVIWRQGQSDIWARRYVSSTETWDDPEKVSSLADRSGEPRVALSANGSAVAVWSQGPSENLNLYASYYTPGVGWSLPELIEQGTGDPLNVDVGVDGSGNAIAVWRQFDGARDSVYANRFVAGDGWGAATLIEGLETGAANHQKSLQIAMDEGGDAVVVWLQDEGANVNLWSNRYDVDTGWQEELLLENHDVWAVSPAVTINSSGMTMVVWQKFELATELTQFRSKVYTPGEGWGAEETFEYSSINYYDYDVAIDDSGNAVLFWSYEDQDSGNSKLWFNRYRSQAGWASAIELPVVGDDYGDFEPHVSANSDGEAMAIFGVWLTDSKGVWTRLFN
ncbi:Ig-like domain-containing protein [Marinobacter sp. CHS3-4]|uniref:Ig-like domain-containing protein n=1 Tax=Marinobacter sp. CHS3-4 TaxID=3045174 RepID=UPI0024B4BEFA|nr:Ig-like domain-containing protein [Marinobacter sp. CHS3-4]MDI9246018.1 Ig-like domain-containing protein [Marinobacter sp. CHS3-4]